MDRDAMQSPAVEATAQAPGADDGRRRSAPGARRRLGQQVQERPVARADRHRRARRVLAEGRGHQRGQARVAALEVEHQLGPRAHRGQEPVEPQPRSPRRGERPAVPQHRHRTERLQVADLDPARVEVQVSLDDCDAELLRSSQAIEVVPGTVRDDERARAARGGTRRRRDRRYALHGRPV